jgi:hypothetical protein
VSIHDEVKQVISPVSMMGGKPDSIAIAQRADTTTFDVTVYHGEQKTHYVVERDWHITPVNADKRDHMGRVK